MNTLKINGTTIPGIYVDAAVSYNKPAKRVQTFEVPGRNGNLIIDEGTFDNVMITYPVYEKQTFPAEFDDLVNWLASLEGYQRIECSNDPGHYRLGRFVVPQTPTVKRLNRDGYYQLSFDCKPQRWLLSGEEDTEVDANPQETYEGEIVSFEAEPLDVISDLKVAIEPVQNLNGQANPYPAGGGKNLLSPFVKGVAINDSNGAEASSTKSATTDFIPVDFTTNPNYYLSGMLASLRSFVAGYNASKQFVHRTGAISQANWSLTSSSFTAGTAQGSGDIVYLRVTTYEESGLSGNINDIDNMQAQLEVGSSATAYHPYSNICPISGWTGAKVTRTGKNLCNVNANGLQSAYINFNGDIILNSSWTVSEYIPVIAGESYVLSGLTAHPNTGTDHFLFYDADKNKTGKTSKYAGVVFTIPSGVAFIRFCWKNEDKNTVMFEQGTTASAYEPFGDTYNVPLGQTVYGGTLDVTTGLLTVTHKGLILNGTESWSAWVVSGTLKKTISDMKLRSLGYDVVPTEIHCSHLATASRRAVAEKTLPCISLDSGSTPIIIIYSGTDTASQSAWQSYCATQYANGTPVTLVYELATPLTYQLTPTEVETLLGINNIWANTGDVSVTVTTPTNFINPGNFPSRPLLRIYGTGTVRINDVYITTAAHTQPYIDIDCEIQECYYEDTNMNEYVTFSTGEYPELEPGNNYVLLGSGITRIDVTPRWWEL